MNKRTLAVSGAAVVALGAAALLLPNANASQDKTTDVKTFSSPSAVKLARSLASDLGDNGAGWYFNNDTSQLVMNVMTEDAAKTVEAQGAVAKIVQNSMSELTAATKTLSTDASVAGTAWSIDPVTNKVRVTADKTVTGAKWDTLTKATDAMDGMVTVQRTKGEFKRFDGGDNGQTGANGGGGAGEAAGDAAGDAAAGGAGDAAGAGGAGQAGAGGAGDAAAGGAGDAGAGGAGDAGAGGAGGAGDAAGGAGDAAGGAGGAAGGGDAATGGVVGGDAIFGGGARCSLGFNVSVDGAPGFLTAGHCGNESETWTADQAGAQALGTVQDTKFPETDFALVMYDDATTQPESAVKLADGTNQAIGRAVEASVGLKVQRSGSTTGVSDGEVTGLNATVNYGGGDIVNGLIQTNVCAEPGDSGGAMFAGDAAVGLTSGGSGDCTQGGETFFQPVTGALEATGAVIGAGDAGAGDAGAANAGAGGEGAANAGAGDAGAANAGAGDAGAAGAGAGDEGAANAGAGGEGAANAGAGDAGAANAGADAGANAGANAGTGNADQNGAAAGGTGVN
ncbi:S1 family peptidase [Streptomyces sp. NPDC021098]|uniref:S1 family peptidase n=1 Tax=unclassified Streptomyces TaxID=2593676 RepID=UPI0037BA2F9B